MKPLLEQMIQSDKAGRLSFRIFCFLNSDRTELYTISNNQRPNRVDRIEKPEELRIQSDELTLKPKREKPDQSVLRHQARFRFTRPKASFAHPSYKSRRQKRTFKYLQGDLRQVLTDTNIKLLFIIIFSKKKLIRILSV